MTRRELATLGGGCFWCVEAVFEQLRGVLEVRPGYAGGSPPNPSYELVCTGTTGHAEVVQLAFDPAVIGYREVLQVFFVTHDPTTLNRQGADWGTQYRSVIFTHDETQRATAEAVIRDLTREGVFDRPIVTELAPFDVFYPAESHHQQYYRRNAGKPYCQAVIAPKIAKLRQAYLERLKPEFAPR